MSVARPVRGLLATPGMAAVHVAFVSGYAVMLLVQFLMPFFLARSLQTPATATGLILLAVPSATAATGALGGALADRLGGRLVALAGAGTIASGVALLLPLSTDWVPGSVAWRLAILGVGFGLFLSPSMSLAMQLAPRQLRGVAAASTNLARFVGLALGPAAATTIWAASDDRLAGMRAALVFALTASLVAVSALLRVSQGSQPAEPRERSAPHALPPITADGTHHTDNCPRPRALAVTPLDELERRLDAKRAHLEKLRHTFLYIGPPSTGSTAALGPLTHRARADEASVDAPPQQVPAVYQTPDRTLPRLPLDMQDPKLAFA